MFEAKKRIVLAAVAFSFVVVMVSSVTRPYLSLLIGMLAAWEGWHWAGYLDGDFSFAS